MLSLVAILVIKIGVEVGLLLLSWLPRLLRMHLEILLLHHSWLLLLLHRRLVGELRRSHVTRLRLVLVVELLMRWHLLLRLKLSLRLHLEVGHRHLVRLHVNLRLVGDVVDLRHVRVLLVLGLVLEVGCMWVRHALRRGAAHRRRNCIACLRFFDSLISRRRCLRGLLLGWELSRPQLLNLRASVAVVATLRANLAAIFGGASEPVPIEGPLVRG